MPARTVMPKEILMRSHNLVLAAIFGVTAFAGASAKAESLFESGFSFFKPPAYVNRDIGAQQPKGGPGAYADFTGKNGAPRYIADQGRSYAPRCGKVWHRFFDENGLHVDRPVTVCN